SRPKFRDRLFEPDVGAVLLDQAGGVTDDFRIEEGLALRIVKGGNGHAPGALARDAPVGPAFDRRFDAALAPLGDPLDLLDGGQCGLTKVLMVDCDEPLAHRAKDYRRFAPPAERITVMIILLMHQGVAQAQFTEDGFVRL